MRRIATRGRPRRRSREIVSIAITLAFACALPGCAAPNQPGRDYSAFRQSKPVSILVMPPLNESPDINGSAAVLAQATQPLAEGGYYVVPVTLMEETFRQNGVTTAHDASEVPLDRLRRIFGADAALYLTVKQYGTRYMVLTSETLVVIEGRLVDLRDGSVLWSGSAHASSADTSTSQSGLLAMLVTAAVMQITDSATGAGYRYAGMAQRQLLYPRRNGLLYGPRSPKHGSDG